jgi:Lipid A 3-O-deacylase (PagL)
MRPRLLILAPFLVPFVTPLVCPLALAGQSAQSADQPPYEIFAGYSLLSNSFNGVPGSRQALNGEDVSVALPPWRGLRVKIDVTRYSGTNLGAKQQALSILGGGQYERTFHRERWFVEALFGDIGMNRYWGPNALPGMTASFSTLFGGGLDTPLNRHFAIRVQGDYRYSNLALIQSTSFTLPYRVPGLPQNFGSFSTGLVWMPRADSSTVTQTSEPKSPVDGELNFEDLNSFGHYHIFANSWWSYLHVAGVEYDRHSWGTFIGARRDYVAEVLPVSILRQPSKTDVWGNPKSSTYENLYGLGISPVGMRLIWRDGKAWKPYYSVKGGLIGFNQKSLSQYGSYMNFSLQQTVGIQFRLTDRFDLRTGFDDFHFSDAFMVPSNPGIDEMAYSAGLTFHVGKRTSGL